MEQTLTVDPSKTNEVEILAYNSSGLVAAAPLRFQVDAGAWLSASGRARLCWQSASTPI